METQQDPLLMKSGLAASAILSKALQQPVVLQEGQVLSGSGRSNLFRFQLQDAPVEGISSVIVKRAGGAASESYDPQVVNAASKQLFCEWAGLEFLDQACRNDRVVPRFFGGDRAEGLVVMEDLGGGGRLDHLLLGNDPAAAEQGLLQMASKLGSLHGATLGQQDRYDRIRSALGPQEADFDAQTACAAWSKTLGETAETHGIVLSAGALAEVSALTRVFDAHGPFWAYTHKDPCPDNWIGAADQLWLIDFEFSGFGNALLDGVYGRIHFPSCWCVSRIPDAVVAGMEQVYRRELGRTSSVARDEALYQHALVEACAVHALRALQLLQRRGNGTWGLVTVLQRAIVRLDILARTTAQFGHLEALGATCGQVAVKLGQTAPPEEQEMPLYPAFR